MAVEIGINPITWTNDDMPELGGDIPLETCLRETREAGYCGTELGGKFPRTARELGPILARIDLRLVSGWYDGRILEREWRRSSMRSLPHLTCCATSAARHMVYADTSRGRHDGIFQPISRRPVLAAERMAALRTQGDGAGRADGGVRRRMAFHHHMGTIVETEAEIDRLMAATGAAVGLLFDSGHCLFAGGDPAALLKRHMRRVVHVHCKDVRRPMLERARAEDMGFMGAVLDGIFTVPGDGCIDFLALLRLLRERTMPAGWSWRPSRTRARRIL